MEKDEFEARARIIKLPQSTWNIILNRGGLFSQFPPGFQFEIQHCEQLLAGTFNYKQAVAPSSIIYSQDVAQAQGLVVVPTPQTQTAPKSKQNDESGFNGVILGIAVILIIAATLMFLNQSNNTADAPSVFASSPASITTSCPESYQSSSHLDFVDQVIQKDESGNDIYGYLPISSPTLKEEASCLSFSENEIRKSMDQKIDLQNPDGYNAYNGREILTIMIRRSTAKALGKDITNNPADKKWAETTYQKIYNALDPQKFQNAGDGYMYLILPGLADEVEPIPTATTPSTPTSAPILPTVTSTPQPSETPVLEITPLGPYVKPKVPDQVTIWELAKVFDEQGWSSMQTSCVSADGMQQVIDFGTIKVDFTGWQFSPYYTLERCQALAGAIKIENKAHFGDSAWIQMGTLWVSPSGCEASGCQAPQIADRDLPRTLQKFVEAMKQLGIKSAVSDGHDRFNWLMRYTNKDGSKDYLVLDSSEQMPDSCSGASKISIATSALDTSYEHVNAVNVWVKCEK